MNCMKCAEEIEAGQVFCQECLAEMEKYPVKPGTVILLPQKKETGYVRKPPRRRERSPEEQLLALKKRMKLLWLALAISLALLAALAKPAVTHLLEKQDFLPGQNYSAVTETTPSESQAK